MNDEQKLTDFDADKKGIALIAAILTLITIGVILFGDQYK